MPRGPLRTGENASTSTARTTGGRCGHLTGVPAGVATQRTVRLGRQPGEAGTRGEAKDAQESVSTRLLRHGTLAAVPPPRAPARVRQATFAWVASVTTSRVASGAPCVQWRGAHPSARVPSRWPSLPPAFLRRPFRGRPPRAPLQRSPPPPCDACPSTSPPRAAQRSAVLRAARARPPEPGAAGLPGRSGFRGAWSRYAGDCPCALSVAASRVRRDQDRLMRVWCCDRTIVYRRHAISGSEPTSSQLWWCPAIALGLSRSLNVSYIWTHPALQGQCCLMVLSTSWNIADGRLPREAT
jgi:hypothetical protein